MASLKDDNINFDKLESSVHNAMDAESLYWLQNDAKFRAVKQKGSYEEFKEIVAAAHLRPLAKNDKIQLEEKIVSPWNPSTNAMKVTETGQPPTEISSSSFPTSPNEFVLQWRKLKLTEARAEYLKQILVEETGPSRLAALFKNELPFGLLGEFIISLSDHCTKFGSETLHSFLRCLSQTGRFGLTLTFLSSKEKESLQLVLQYIHDSGISCSELETLYGIEL